MIINDSAVVLWRRDVGECDRRAVLLTENHGKLPVRFGGVNRPAGKLKALSEPVVWGEYRLFFSARSPAVHVVGGRLESVFPALRNDLARTMTAFSLCELAMNLCAERAPSPDKYRLLCRALCILDQGGHPWLETAFGLKLLESAGYSLRDLPVPPAESGLWQALHESELEGLGAVPWRPAAGRRFLQVVRDHVEAHAERLLRAPAVTERLDNFASSLLPQKESVPC